MPHKPHGALIANAAQLSPANCSSRQVSTTWLPQRARDSGWEGAVEREGKQVFGCHVSFCPFNVSLLATGNNWPAAIKTKAQLALTINP